MVFSSPTFICLFLPLTLASISCCPIHEQPVLVAASLVFYGWGDPVAALSLIIPSVLINFRLGQSIAAATGASRRKLMLARSSSISGCWLFSNIRASSSAT